MIALPADRVEAYEAFLFSRWMDRSWYVRRGSLGCSFGLLGLRWSEVEVMRPEDLLVDGGQLYVRTRKRGRPRVIDVPSGLLRAALQLRSEVRGGDDRVFTTAKGRGMGYGDIRRFTKTSTAKVFGRSFSFHCFRHTAAVRVYQRTGDVLAVQRFLGHKSLQWTNAYLQSLMVVDIGGPAAFAGGGKVKRPRLFDPERVVVQSSVASYGKAAAGDDAEAFGVDRRSEVGGEGGRVGVAVAESRAGGRATSFRGLHVCHRELMPVKMFRVPGMLYAICKVCGAVFESKPGDPIEAAVKVEEGSRTWTAREALEASRCEHVWRVRGERDGGEVVVCRDCGKVYGRTPAKEVERREAAASKVGRRRDCEGQRLLF